MSTPESNRDDLVAAILRATADLAAGRSAFGERVARRLGLAATDVDVLRRLGAEGPMTVGRIGDVTGLTTGATTRLVDRLEQSGFVRRVADPADRRRVVVEVAGDRVAGLAQAFASVELGARRALEPLDGGTLAVLAAYLEAAAAGYDAGGLGATGRDADDAEVGAATTASVTGPIAAARAGRLVFVTAAPSVTIKGARDMGTELYRARITGAVPSARVRDGIVTIRYPRLAWFDWRARIGDQYLSASAHWRTDRTQVTLNGTVPWTIDLRGGASSLVADLRELTLAAFDLTGGSPSVGLTLGRPAGTVRVRFKGGTGDVTITRPAGTAATLTVKGGNGRATLDGVAGRGTTRLATPRADHAADRYDIELLGGVSQVTVRGA